MGLDNREAGDQAAVDAMRAVLQTVEMDGIVVIGEGEKDKAPMLHNGEAVGSGHPPAVDVAVDPVEGTRLLALGRPNAISVIAITERGGHVATRSLPLYEQNCGRADGMASH
jgi:fructose-1,6-bisphosphatase II